MDLSNIQDYSRQFLKFAVTSILHLRCRFRVHPKKPARTKVRAGLNFNCVQTIDDYCVG